MIILVDAEDRENEGDLVVPAQMATPDAINFMAKHGRGLICLSLTHSARAQLRLEYMARQNEARNRTAFTVSIEAREGISTGISAHDRARTIATAIDPTKGSTDIVSPGHVFPLIAREGGVLVRAGHTEASVDLARLAGLYPAGVICEIMNDDGTMARMPDLVAFAQRHGLKIGTIEDLIGYRLRNDQIVKRGGEDAVESAHRRRLRAARVTRPTVEPVEHLALVKGDLGAPGPVLVRVHAVNVLDRLLGIGAGGTRDSLIDKAMRAIERGGPRRDRADPRSAAQVACRTWIAQNARARRVRKRRARASAARSRSASARRSCATLGVSDMVLLTNAPAHRATSASRPSGCASSASAGGSESHGRPVQATADGSDVRPHRRAGARTSSSSRRLTTRTSPTSWPRARSPSSRRGAPPTSASSCRARWRSRRRWPRRCRPA